MDNPQTGTTLSRSAFWKWSKRLYVTCVAVVLCWAAISAWPTLSLWPARQLIPALLSLAIGWTAMVILLGRGWAGSLLAWTGTRLTIREWLPLQLIAWSGRYLPGKLGLAAGKLQICERGIPWKSVMGSVLSEQLAFIISGLSLSALALPYWATQLPDFLQPESHHISMWQLLLTFPPLVVGGMAGMAMVRANPVMMRRTWGFQLLAWSLLAHICAGSGFHLLLQSLLESPPNWPQSIGLLAAAHTAGVLAFFAPAGLGVREAVIASALAPQLGWPQALAISALQRGLVAIIDSGLAIATFTLRNRN